MKRGRIVLLLILIISFVSFKSDAETLDTSRISSGVIGITPPVQANLKVRIKKGNDKYDYDINSSGAKENFPLQMGNGSYSIMILGKVAGNKYKVITNQNVSVSMANANSVWLQSVQNVNWNSSMNAISHGADISKGKDSTGSFNAFYDDITKTVSYDYNLAKNVKTGYIPNIEHTYEVKKGICYDYSALLGGVNRSKGIPTKLVKGYAPGVEGYHAWNEVLINNKWYVVDTTVDATKIQKGKSAVKLKDGKGYKAMRYY